MGRKSALIILFAALMLVLVIGCSGDDSQAPTATEATGMRVATVTATPTPEAVENSLIALQQRLEEELRPFGQNASIAVTDLQTGETISVNGDVPFYPASTIKAIVLLSVLKDAQDGLYPRWELWDDLYEMMKYSDNTAADTLIEKTGFEQIGSIIEQAGLKDTIFCHGFDYLAEVCDTPNQMTANDANLLWSAVYEGKILSVEYRGLALGEAALPEEQFIFASDELFVAHKPGYAGPYLSDSGLVDLDGYWYAVSFFSEGLEVPDRAAWEATRIVFNWFVDKYRPGYRPEVTPSQPHWGELN